MSCLILVCAKCGAAVEVGMVLPMCKCGSMDVVREWDEEFDEVEEAGD